MCGMKISGIKISVLALVILAGFGYGGYLYWGLNEHNKQLQEQITELQQQLGTATSTLEQTQNEKEATSQALKSEQDKNTVFEAKINEVSLVVGSLQKLSSTDPELLKKYSKVYFLSENYIPAQLSSIDPQYLYEKNRPQLIHSGVLPHLQELLTATEQSNLKLQIVSAYRSFYDQETVKSGYKVLYGSGANQFSADQGYSEHQLGTAVDFTTPEVNGRFSEFEKSPAVTWLMDNAYKFGFVLSYPKNNSYYQFEPWHWRYVGVALAKYLHEQNKNFYDLDQREIDTYRISFFN
ncbi:MAG: D-alanyl-D-alanine carboxypeptidase [Parcubacteria group bacterium Gr01-1014_19]|nr:MAG: D-alanyl-D-alanine carboxypeptidase [Parcubacteria group bacterium Gr01-1014_19]